MTAPKVEGVVKQKALASVKPNGWNPNRLSPRVYASLVRGMKTEGWIASQPLLIWGKDEKGKARNLIIDGEHRWKAATEIGFKQGPMVVLDGLTEAQAKALTVKLDQRRGNFNHAELGDLLRELDGTGLFGEELALELGFEDDAMDLLLGESDGALPPPTESRNPSTKRVPLHLPVGEHDAFMRHVGMLGKRYGTDTVTETVMECVRRAVKEDG